MQQLDGTPLNDTQIQDALALIGRGADEILKREELHENQSPLKAYRAIKAVCAENGFAPPTATPSPWEWSAPTRWRCRRSTGS